MLLTKHQCFGHKIDEAPKLEDAEGFLPRGFKPSFRFCAIFSPVRSFVRPVFKYKIRTTCISKCTRKFFVIRKTPPTFLRNEHGFG